MATLSVTPAPSPRGSLALGTASLDRDGVELFTRGYSEREYLVSGVATVWTYDAAGVAAADHEAPFTTRVLVRAPVDPARFTGTVIAEALHREYDVAPTWGATHAWITATGAAWLGVTQDPISATSMREAFDPERYAALSIPEAGLGYDIVGAVARAARDGEFGVPAPVPHMLLTGWSMTGTFCRVFLGDGFHARHRRHGGRPVFDGYLIGISSGAAPRAGYAQLSDLAAAPATGDPRRTIGAHDVPVIELLSEFESETHVPCLRADSDAGADRYRLYQVAGTSHLSFGGFGHTVNREQYRRRGLPVPDRRINEPPSDARGDTLARGVLAALARWVSDGVAPPRVQRFAYDHGAPAPVNPTGDAVALQRDQDGNAVGGLRTPWVAVPVASYVPHSTPRPGSCLPAPGAPTLTPEHVAALIGHATPLSPAALRARYGTRAHYLARYGDACNALHAEGLLLADDVTLLNEQARRRYLALG